MSTPATDLDPVAVLLRDASALCDSAAVYRAAGLKIVADQKRRDALRLIHKAQQMMDRREVQAS